MLLPGAFSPAGGIEMYNRLLIKCVDKLCVDRGAEAHVLSLNDRAEVADSRYVTSPKLSYRSLHGSRPAFVGRALAAAVRGVTHVMVGHVNFGPLALAIRAISRAQQWLFIYGIDAWRRLPCMKRRALNRANLILSISDFTRHVCARSNRIDVDRIKLLPCALDPLWQAQRDSAPGGAEVPQAPIVLTVTRLASSERYKGVDKVLEAMLQVRREVPNARYVLVGSGEDSARLEQKVRDLGLSATVTFAGRVSEAELDSWYRRCTVFVLPSRREGFGIVFIEAGYYRKPVIGGDHAGSREVIVDGKTGFLVNHHNVDLLAKRIIGLLKDSGQARALGENGRAHVEEKFLYPEFCRRFIGFFSDP
ncbi:MAG: hypothetical protein FD180_1854 [Planctomycetota bacterium]|nr:MAG: hypothetical protein FD180_1854 [Planctomycetota bacterium]